MAQNRYVFAQRDVDDYSCIKIVEGPYKDIIYTYGHVKFASEENERGELPLKFDYDIKKNPNDVAIPVIVVRIAIMSIVAARGLLFSTVDPRRELTLKGLFLL